LTSQAAHRRTEGYHPDFNHHGETRMMLKVSGYEPNRTEKWINTDKIIWVNYNERYIRYDILVDFEGARSRFMKSRRPAPWNGS